MNSDTTTTNTTSARQAESLNRLADEAEQAGASTLAQMYRNAAAKAAS